MKRTYIFIFAMLFCRIAANAQDDQPTVGDAFRFKTMYTLNECDVDGANHRAVKPIPNGSSFNIIKIMDDEYIISFWEWGIETYAVPGTGQQSNREKRLSLNYDISIPASPQHRYFTIPKTAFPGNTTRLYQRFAPTIGMLTLPFKIRRQFGTVFEKTFSISVTGGYSCLINPTNKHNSIAITAGIGGTTATLNSDNTSSSSGITEEENKAAAMPSLSLVYIHDRLQVALSCGKDYLVDGNKSGWIYNGRTWWSIGIGVNIFTPDNPSKQTTGDQP